MSDIDKCNCKPFSEGIMYTGDCPIHQAKMTYISLKKLLDEHPELKAKLEALIQEQVRLARIDEVERFLVEPGEVIPYNNNTFADGFRYVVEKLQARLEELRGEK
jgi:hypothetical protein